VNKERGERRIREGGNTREGGTYFWEHYFHMGGLYFWFCWRSLLEDCITGFV
jgi:hypothetical protein